MSAQAQAPKQTTDLSVEELEAALKLLIAEGRTEGRDLRKYLQYVLLLVAMGVGFVACPAGLILLIFDFGLGLILLGIAVVAAVLFSILMIVDADVYDKTQEMTKSLGEGELANSAKDIWQEQSPDDSNFGCAVSIICVITFVVGVLWFFFSLFTGSVSLLSIVLVMLAVIVFFGHIAVGGWKEYQFYTRVTKLQKEYQSLLNKARAEDLNTMTVPTKDVTLFGEIETAQLNRQVYNIKKDQEIFEDFYSVKKYPELLKYVRQLSVSERDQINDLIDSLQTEPHPENAKPISDQPGLFTIESGNHEIVFSVNDEKKQIYCTEVRQKDNGGGTG